MGNCLSICRSRKIKNPGDNTIPNNILPNQIGPYSKNNESSRSLNNKTNKNDILQQGNKEQLIQINNDLKDKFNNMKNTIFYHDMKKKNKYISNYKSFLNDLNHELNNYHEQLNISICGKKLGETLLNKEDKSLLLKELDQISFQIKEINSILETQNSELKNLELNYKIIQEKFNLIKLNESKDDINQEILLSQNNKIISNQLNELDKISKRLKKNKSLYEAKKNEIEKKIKNIQKKN